jgi:hypothetical protein
MIENLKAKVNQLLMKKSKGEQNIYIVLGLSVLIIFILISFINAPEEILITFNESGII